MMGNHYLSDAGDADTSEGNMSKGMEGSGACTRIGDVRNEPERGRISE